MANVKISQLAALTPPAASDELPVVDVSATSTKKTTVGEVVGIINGDVEVANDGTATISELPVSKLQDGAARQLLQTDAAGTGVEWTSNVDVPGTLDVTGAATLDSTLTVPLGSAAAPTLRFTGDTNTGIYSPGADQVAISTNGTGRLFVDASGTVSITPSNALPLFISRSSDGELFRARRVGGTYNPGLTISASDTTNNEIVFNTAYSLGSAPQYVWQSGSNERMRLDSSGRLGLGTSSPNSLLHLYGGGAIQNIEASSTTVPSYIKFTGNSSDWAYFGLEKGDGNGGIIGTGAGYACLLNTTSTNPIVFGTNNTERVRITGTGAVGIGFTTVEAALHAGGNSNSPVIFAGVDSGDVTYKFRQSRGTITSPGDTGGEGVRLSFEKYNGSGSAWASPIAQIYAAGGGSGADGYLAFLTKPSGGSATERARIDTSGRLLVGTSTARNSNTGVKLQIEDLGGSTPAIEVISDYTNSSADGASFLFLSRAGSTALGSTTAVASGNELGSIRFRGHDGTGFINAASISTFVDGTPGANDMPCCLVFSTTADGASSPTERMRIRANGTISVFGGFGVGSSADPGSTFAIASTVIASGAGNSTLKYNTTTGIVTYDTSSRLVKESIVDCPYGVDAVKLLQPRKYFRTDDKRDEIGFIADELVGVLPEFVPIGPKSVITKNEEDTEDIPLGVNYEKLTAVLTKALQEAIAKIEVLEQRLTNAGIA